MSIGPIESFTTAATSTSANAKADSRLAASRSAFSAAAVTPKTHSGSVPNQENSPAKSVSSTNELPEDVVEVHQDPEIKDQIIIQYLDKAKDVILQVPSSQELSVERGIAQEFQQAAKLRAASIDASQGEEHHGD